MRIILILGILWWNAFFVSAQVWQPDLGNGYYKNPIIHADYSDPDIVRVGEDFYMTASSFNCSPGLPILHSKDLIHWEIVNYAFDRQLPDATFSSPQHGNGVWAPAIRYHNGYYYIFYGDPDFGIYMTKTQDPESDWSEPKLIAEAKGWIDPCPLWDEDGKAYLVHAFAGSRASFKSVVVVHEMKPDGTELIGDAVMVFDGHAEHPTIEGTKFYKRNGYYYIFAPAGGVATGWQTVLRSKNIFGPYEDRIVLHQGQTAINGPHQGGWVELESGEYWFVHFQDKGAYGRIVHLQPMQWTVDDWCVIGQDEDGDGIGEPILKHKKPTIRTAKTTVVPQMSDDFEQHKLGLQWQWNANPQPTWAYLTSWGSLRLNTVEFDKDFVNLWSAGNILAQKFPAETFSVTTEMKFQAAARKNPHEKAGLIIMGLDYAYICLEQKDSQLYLTQAVCKNAETGNAETVVEKIAFDNTTIYMKVEVFEGGVCQFYYSKNGKYFKPFGQQFTAKEGKWIGAKVGLFTWRHGKTNDAGFADFYDFKIE